MARGDFAKFTSHLPSEEVIADLVREYSGLEVEVTPDVFGPFIRIKGPQKTRFTDVELRFNDKESIIQTTGFRHKMYYLLALVLRALIELGGECEVELPSWAYKKWADVKIKFLIPK